MRAFPERFDFAPEVWKGRRAASFTKREDAFQRLVGAVFREALGAYVREVPTEGRDGGIDAFIAEGAPACLILPPLVGPTIVEGKDNDEEGKSVIDSVFSAFRKLKEKVLRQAAAGWPGLYRPWHEARGYVYVTSARLHTDARQRLNDELEALFRALRSKRQCNIDQVCVVDWTDLRALLDLYPRLADDWLGTGSNVLVAHSERAAAVSTEFGRYLVTIPFVAPDERDGVHPDQVFRRVDARVQRGGVLVVGIGGIGKTRLLFEVAQRANDQGWRVLHAIEGDSTLRYEQLATEVLIGSGNVLIVADYFDRLKPDIKTIRRLLQAAALRGLRIAFLASARVQERVITSPEIGEFFEVVELRRDAGRAERLLHEMERHVAPSAARILGTARIAVLAGEVPVIALIFLQEIERRAKEGTLDKRELRGLRPGKLVQWVRHRLDEDELLVAPPRNPLDSPPVAARNVAVAAVLAASPQTEEELHELALAVLRTNVERDGGRAASRRQAMNLIDGLRHMGWLIRADGQLVASHDVVTDEMLIDVLKDERGRLRDEELDAVLSPAVRSPRVLGRFAFALGRLFGHLGSFEHALQAGAACWLRENADRLGSALAGADAMEAAYALYAMLSGPPWADALVESWDRVVEPWRQRHADAADSWAVHVALLGRRELCRIHAATAVQMAMAWVGKHGGTEDAAAVLVHLLDRVDLDEDAESRATTAALLWHDQNREAEMAPSVLGLVVQKTRVAPENVSLAAQAILDWCRARGAPSAGFALGMLLSREDLGAELEPHALATASGWLEEHGDSEQAGFVLAALLSREEDEPHRREGSIERALSWCDRQGNSFAAGFLLNVLLASDRTSLDEAHRVARLGYRWFEGRREDPFLTIVVLVNLVGSPDLARDEVAVLVRAALQWIARYGNYPQSTLLLHRLLTRLDFEPGMRDEIDRAALAWCERHADRDENGTVLAMLLDRLHEPAVAARAIDAARAFLATHPSAGSFAWVLGAVLARPELASDDAAGLIEAARSWLNAHRGEDEAGLLFMGLMGGQRMELQDIDVVGSALAWLLERPLREVAALVLVRLLALEHMDADVASRVKSSAIDWLERHGSRREAILVFLPLIDRGGLSDDAQKRVDALVPARLAGREHHFEAGALLGYLFSRAASQDRDELTSRALSWLERHGSHLVAGNLLHWLLRRADLPPNAASRVMTFASAWLELHGANDEAPAVLAPLLMREDFDAHAAESSVVIALRWMDEHALGADQYGVLINALLTLDIRRGALSIKALSRATERALAWLDARSDSDLAGIIPLCVLGNPRVAPHAAATAASRALDWLERHGEAGTAPFSLAGLLEAWQDDPRLERVVATSLAWVGAHHQRANADLLLSQLLLVLKAGSKEYNGIFLHALGWLGRHGRGSAPSALFKLFYSSEGEGGMPVRVGRAVVRARLEVIEAFAVDEVIDILALILPALLPFMARVSRTLLQEKGVPVARAVVASAKLSDEQRESMLESLRRLVDVGAWPSLEQAEKVLRQLGVRRR